MSGERTLFNSFFGGVDKRGNIYYFIKNNYVPVVIATI